MPNESSTIAAAADPRGGFASLDRDTAAITETNDPPSKRQCP